MNTDNTFSILQEADKDEEIAALKEALAEKSEEIKRLNSWNESEKILPKYGQLVLGWEKVLQGYVLCSFNYGKWSCGDNSSYLISHWKELPLRP